VSCPVGSSDSHLSDFVMVNNAHNDDMDSESDDTREYINVLNSITIPLNEPVPLSLTVPSRRASSVQTLKKTQ
jgi:hypothetical protein